jgi:hypothetical protein
MRKSQKLALARRSRRDFAKLLGLAVAGSAMAPELEASAPADDADVEALVKLATEGSAVRLREAELVDLKKDIEEGRKALSKVRDFKVQASVEPAFVFLAK